MLIYLFIFSIVDAKFTLPIEILDAGEFKKFVEIIKNTKKEGDRLLLESYYHFYMGKYKEAVDKLERSVMLERTEFKERSLRYLKILVDITDDFETWVSTYFVMKTRGRDKILKYYFFPYAEKIYKEIGKIFNYFPDEKVRIEVYPLKKEFSIASTIPMEKLETSGAIGVAKFNRIMVLSPQLLPYGYRWIDTIAHEYIHHVINIVSKGKCPVWLQEGLARFYDTRWRSEKSLYLTPSNKNLLIKIKNGEAFVPFSKVSHSLIYLKDQDEISLAFVEFASFVEFLKEVYGEDKIPLLLKNLYEKGLGKAFDATFGAQLEDLIEMWKAYLQELNIEYSTGVVKERIYFDEGIDNFIGVGARGHIRLGDMFRHRGRYRLSILQYKRALSKEPFNPIILTRVAKVKFLLNEFEEAERALKLAIEKNPNFISPYEVLGRYYFKNGHFSKAIKIYNEAISINPFNPRVHKELAIAYHKIGKLSDAKREFEVTLILTPSDIESKLLLQTIE